MFLPAPINMRGHGLCLTLLKIKWKKSTQSKKWQLHKFSPPDTPFKSWWLRIDWPSALFENCCIRKTALTATPLKRTWGFSALLESFLTKFNSPTSKIVPFSLIYMRLRRKAGAMTLSEENYEGWVKYLLMDARNNLSAWALKLSFPLVDIDHQNQVHTDYQPM